MCSAVDIWSAGMFIGITVGILSVMWGEESSEIAVGTGELLERFGPVVPECRLWH